MRGAELVLVMKKLMAAGIGLMGCTEVVVPGAMAGGGEYYRSLYLLLCCKRALVPLPKPTAGGSLGCDGRHFTLAHE